MMLMKLGFVAGTYIIRVALDSATDDFVVDFVALSPAGDLYIETAGIKNVSGKTVRR
jgi:hypothetical protein